MLEPKDLPEGMTPHLRELVCAFGNSHGSLRLMENSFGECGEVTWEFAQFLRKQKYAGELELADWFFAYNPDKESWELTEGFEMPDRILELFCQDSASMEAHEGHTAIYVDNRWFIDFTATQFGIDEWPLIWELHNAVLSSEP
jgi:hypothetical protein